MPCHPRSALCCLAACLLAAHAYGRSPGQLSVRSSSDCPRAVDVARELGPILPTTAIRVEGESSVGEGERATIEDLGGEVSIRVAGEERTIRDAARACTERARAAAVFIGLVLDPPVLPEPAERAPRPTTVVGPPKAASRPEPQAAVSIELAPVIHVAAGSDALEVPIAGGFGGRLVWGRELGASFGVAGFLPTTLHFEAADAEIWSLPFDLAFRGTTRFEPLVLSAEIGPEVALLFAKGVHIEHARTSVRADVGVRGAILAAWMVSRGLRVFVDFHAVLFPRPYDLDLSPSGHAGRTAPWWIGGAAGLAFDVL